MMKKKHSILPCLFLLLLWIASGRSAQAQALDAFLSNSMVKVGVNSGSYGGAIVWLSASDVGNPDGPDNPTPHEN
jgi:hypothetical protein